LQEFESNPNKSYFRARHNKHGTESRHCFPPLEKTRELRREKLTVAMHEII